MDGVIGEINAMRFQPAFKHMTDAAWLKVVRTLFRNGDNLQIKDGLVSWKA